MKRLLNNFARAIAGGVRSFLGVITRLGGFMAITVAIGLFAGCFWETNYTCKTSDDPARAAATVACTHHQDKWQKRLNLFQNYGEFIGILLAAFIFCIDLVRKRHEEEGKEFEKEGTARNWVFYNAGNRIQQDLSMLREIYAQYDLYLARASEAGGAAEPPASVATAVTAQSGSSIESLLAMLVKELTQKRRGPQPGKETPSDRFRSVRAVLAGFKDTWKNDDVLNEALAFEFTLLSELEKRKVLEYFEDYNELEDHVSMVYHSLKVDIVQGDATFERASTEIAILRKRMRALIVQGVQLMRIMSEVDKISGLETRLVHIVEQIKKPARLESHSGAEMSYEIDEKKLDQDPFVDLSEEEGREFVGYLRRRSAREKRHRKARVPRGKAIEKTIDRIKKASRDGRRADKKAARDGRRADKEAARESRRAAARARRLDKKASKTDTGASPPPDAPQATGRPAKTKKSKTRNREGA